MLDSMSKRCRPSAPKTPIQVPSCETCEIFAEHLRWLLLPFPSFMYIYIYIYKREKERERERERERKRERKRWDEREIGTTFCLSNTVVFVTRQVIKNNEKFTFITTSLLYLY